jgi:hypothetical protein
MPGGYACSASLKGTLGRSDVKQVSAGEQPIRKLFSKEQREFFSDHAPDGVELDALSILGPITVFKLDETGRGPHRRAADEDAHGAGVLPDRQVQ